jgi:hypothetical protein
MNTALAFTASLLTVTPAMAKTGHVIQVHHGNDCVEFVLLEDAEPACGPNFYTASGAINDTCLQIVPWYGIATGQGVGQTPLTAGELPSFIAGSSAIDTAYKLYEAQLMLEAIQIEEGFSIPTNEGVALNEDTAVGFDLANVTLQCKNLGTSSGKHATNEIGDINTPPGPNQ